MKHKMALMVVTVGFSILAQAGTVCTVAKKKQSHSDVYDQILSTGLYDLQKNLTQTLYKQDQLKVTVHQNDKGSLQITSFSHGAKATIHALAVSSGTSLLVLDSKNELMIVCENN